MPSPTKEKIKFWLDRQFITLTVAAGLAGVKPSTVGGWAEKKLIRSTQDGMYLFVFKPDVEKMIPLVPERKAFAESIKRKGQLAKDMKTVANAPKLNKSNLLQEFANTNINSAIDLFAKNLRKHLLLMLREPMIQKELKRIVINGVTDYAMEVNKTPEV